MDRHRKGLSNKMILVVLNCGICKSRAGIGLDATHAEHNVIQSGGRTFDGNLHICRNCARHTR